MVVYQPTYEAAKLKAPSVWDGRKPSLQAFHLFKKIIEVEGLLLSDPKLKLKIFETHPELGFALLAPGQCPEKKRTVNGCAQRLDALRGIWIEFGWTDEEFHAYRAQARLSRDDATDALMALLTATRIDKGSQIPIPRTLEHDELGLRKQILI
jgi:predicted RNase H-like nuclease